MTNAEFVQKLKNIEARKTLYNNRYPYNVGYYNGTAISFDCWNLIKSLIWDNNIDQNYTVGHYVDIRAGIDATGLGDWDANGIIEHIALNNPSDVSTDFSDLDAIPMGAFLYWNNGSHAGAYIGNGQCIESTVSWGANGITYSDVSVGGARSKNGVVSGAWTKWARMSPWIDYTSSPTPIVEMPEEAIILRADMKRLADVIRSKVHLGRDLIWPDDLIEQVRSLPEL